MAKKIYHIPLQKIRIFISDKKSALHKLLKEKQTMEYYKCLGKMRYDEQIESFLSFFKIDKSIPYALKTMDYFNSHLFMDELSLQLNFAQFDFEGERVSRRDFFYGLSHLLYTKDKALFEQFLQQLFLHYHTSFNKQSNITIDYKEISQTLIKAKKQSIKESFGEDEKGAFFKLLIDGVEQINLRGKSIKSLRKEAYKQLLRELLEG
jgi:hypothetical protein